MATATTNLGLSKPEYTDAADIAVINGNMDTIDATSHTLAKSIGKVVNGNKTAEVEGIAIDEYVSLENSTITGREDGLYKAAKAIPYNTAIDSTYLTATDGGIGGEVKTIADRMGVLREVPFAVAVGDWSGSGNSFTANFNTQYVTANSKEISYFDSSYRTYAKGDINIVKKSGGGGITLTTSTKPTGTITGTILVFANSDGKIPVILEDTVTSIANGGTGQSSLAGAQQVLGITELNSKIAIQVNSGITNLLITKVGAIVNLCAQVCTISSHTHTVVIPDGYRPQNGFMAPIAYVYNGKWASGMAYFTQAGEINVYDVNENQVSGDIQVGFSVSYYSAI